MKIKQGFEDAVKEATLSWEEFNDQFVEFSGNEVELILKFNLPRKCKSKFRYNFSLTDYSGGKPVRRYLPESFHDEFDGSVKHFKDLYFGKYLTQEFFEKDPISAMYLCGGWSSINGQQGLVPLEIQDEYRDLQQTVQKYKRSKRDLSRNTYQLKKQKKEKKLMSKVTYNNGKLVVEPHQYRLDLVGSILAQLIDYELRETFHQIPDEEEDQFDIDAWWSDIKPFLIANVEAIDPDIKIITREGN